MTYVVLFAIAGLVLLEAKDALHERRARRAKEERKRALGGAQLAPKSFDFLAEKVDADAARRGRP